MHICNLAALILLIKLNVTNEWTVSFQQQSRLSLSLSLLQDILCFYGHFLKKKQHT